MECSKKGTNTVYKNSECVWSETSQWMIWKYLTTFVRLKVVLTFEHWSINSCAVRGYTWSLYNTKNEKDSPEHLVKINENLWGSPQIAIKIDPWARNTFNKYSAMRLPWFYDVLEICGCKSIERSTEYSHRIFLWFGVRKDSKSRNTDLWVNSVWPKGI